ncbi:uncharacterized protein A1O9_03705 [Exophiala aquamarina CBS 119918]|uniref:Transcription factor domain-containing protein n=1 Tax=Exophiala aquamarina CBS 119918 TaxID=1182545 RepID=A0A072PGJ4_9EURO|nr:uncharacterized protein A1O9_03705 [Exophiala aquamarina CBS 119918]KEF58862.1 hypothetical protein A1O9_03705 [Exophiala aquamarina CBS 119918]
MLQGLLVLIAWYQFYNHFNPQLMNLLHLCIALTIDLGLNRPQSLGQWQLRVVIDTTSLLHGKGVSQGLRTTDEHRALLGVYFLCAKLSYAFKRLDPMRYTQHLEDCCQFLLTEAEYPSDITLVQHVRLQHILEKYMPDAMGLSALSVPVRSFVKCFEEDIKNFKQSVPRDLLPSAHLEIHILSAQIGLYEFVQTADLDPLIHRIEAWYACLNCISQYWDLFLAEPSENLPTLTFISWLHTIQPLLMLAKLSFLITDGWDLDFVRTKWAFGAFIDRLAEKLESVTRTDVSHTHRTVGARFNMYAEKMRMCKRWYESKIRAENAVKASEAAATLPERPVPNPPSPDIPFQDLFDGLEDGMWQDFMYDWAIPTQF